MVYQNMFACVDDVSSPSMGTSVFCSMLAFCRWLKLLPCVCFLRSFLIQVHSSFPDSFLSKGFRKVNLYSIQRLNHKELTYNIVLINIFFYLVRVYDYRKMSHKLGLQRILQVERNGWSLINTAFSQSLFSTERLDDSFQELDLVITFGYLFLHPSELLHMQLENLWNNIIKPKNMKPDLMQPSQAPHW